MSLPMIDGDPAQGDPDGIRGLAQIFTHRSSDLTERSSHTSSASAELGSTKSETTGALVARTSLLTQRFSEASTASLDAARILNDYASSLDGLKALAARRLQTASDLYDRLQRRRHEAMNQASEAVVGWAIPWDQVISSSIYLSDRGYLTRWQSAIDDYRSAARQYNGLHADRKSLDDSTARSLRGISLVAAVGRGGAVSAGGPGGGDVGMGGRPECAHRGIHREPRRSEDDPRGLERAEARAAGEADVCRPAGDRKPRRHPAARPCHGKSDQYPERDRASSIRGRRSAEADRRAVGAPHSRIQCADLGAACEDRGARDLRLLIPGPAREEVAIGSYYGPIDPQTGDIPAWVKHTAVSVPGTGANMADFSESRAQDLYLASGYDSAVFQWAGGAFPQTIPEATQASYSEKLAPRLASFVDSVNVPSGATMTVLGHSYGGATVGLAEKAGMHADRILYVSAAGMGRGVAGVEDFPNTAHVPHYSMMARHDAVVGLIQGNNGDWNAIHGQSPLNAPSVTRLETGFVDASDHGKGDMESTGVIDSHSKVFTRGSTSFDNMVAVITGSQAELFAPDDLVNTYSGAGPVFIDGVDSPDYSPHYIEVK
ncbi:alpha/beta hydrolase [Microbacterium sp. MRS-1]|uniref:alpha/beta hydrolase n=1 Tax=Microbacterium sp. MRS-1 TaxID=1451261 RepID=UPI0004465CAF|nr:alpha/beta hydrolase [Microbacterium sp. MRS-1]EXJ52439.1 hypothetical protein AS96_04245 [Microbacterium sp. MRS-1]